jgi:hypothetical protein
MGWMGRREALDRVMLVAIALGGLCIAGKPVCKLLPGGGMACVISPVAACVLGLVGVRSLARKSARYGPAARTAYALKGVGWVCLAIVAIWQAVRWALLTIEAPAACTPW